MVSLGGHGQEEPLRFEGKGPRPALWAVAMEPCGPASLEDTGHTHRPRVSTGAHSFATQTWQVVWGQPRVGPARVHACVRSLHLRRGLPGCSRSGAPRGAAVAAQGRARRVAGRAQPAHRQALSLVARAGLAPPGRPLSEARVGSAHGPRGRCHLTGGSRWTCFFPVSEEESVAVRAILSPYLKFFLLELFLTHVWNLLCSTVVLVMTLAQTGGVLPF